MKKKININIAFLSALLVVIALAFASCEKDSDGSPDIKPGTPVLESITPAEAQGGSLVIVKGTGLGSIVSVVFEKETVPASINPTLNTATVLMFRVPANAAGGDQNIIMTNSEGKTLTVPFKVLAYPQLFSVSNYDFVAGAEITITGLNLNDVSSVVLTGTTDEATIVSQTKTSLVITMPATTKNRATLDVTNVTGTTTSTFEMVCIPNNFIVYADAYGTGAFGGGVQSWSWGCTVSEVETGAKTGTKALQVVYTDGGLSLWLGSDTWSDGHWFTDFYQPTYLTFWAKAETNDAQVTVRADGPPATPPETYTVTVPAGVWTYFRVPTSTFSGAYGRINFTNNTASTVTYDDILFVK